MWRSLALLILTSSCSKAPKPVPFLLADWVVSGGCPIALQVRLYNSADGPDVDQLEALGVSGGAAAGLELSPAKAPAHELSVKLRAL